MNRNDVPKESELFLPVSFLFTPSTYRVFSEVKLGRKRIDMLLVPHTVHPWVAIELKVRDWKKALWQALINTQVAEHSYVALWHTSVSAALNQRALFEPYGVGLISVYAQSAEFVVEAHPENNLTRFKQQQMVREALQIQHEDVFTLETISRLSA